MNNCHHYLMYFENGKLICDRCGKNCTPLPGVRIGVVHSDHRDNIIQSLQEIANEVPDDVLHEIEIYAEYLKQRNQNGEVFAQVIKMVGNSSGQFRGKDKKAKK